jgi:hypothetical protein
LKENDIVIIYVDLPENYQCKYSAKIQSLHVGGSHEQVTVHADSLSKNSTLHNNGVLILRRDPCAVLTHIKPIIREIKIKSRFSNIISLHFFSDSHLSRKGIRAVASSV